MGLQRVLQPDKSAVSPPAPPRRGGCFVRGISFPGKHLQPHTLLFKVSGRRLRGDVEKTLERPPGWGGNEEGAGLWPCSPSFLPDRCIEWHLPLAFVEPLVSLADPAGNLMLQRQEGRRMLIRNCPHPTQGLGKGILGWLVLF